MPATFLLKDNRRLSDAELSVARSICREAIASVRKRPRYIRWRRIDPRFALPDANWSYECRTNSCNSSAGSHKAIARR